MWKKYCQELGLFRQKIVTYATELGIYDALCDLQPDHLCLRLRNEEDVRVLYRELCDIGECISRAVVAGRVIYIFELHEPLQFGQWRVPCIELPFPKQNHKYADGWEHVEFELGTASLTIEALRADFGKSFPSLRTQDLELLGQYGESIPSVDGDQLPNPTIELTKQVGLCMKFHARSIADVVRG